MTTASLFEPRRPNVLSVSALNRMARETLERGFPLLWVAGEISNLTRAASGHWYFSLKDEHAQVRCVMFRNRNAALDWVPREGDHVEARALVTLYEARGDFQLTVETLQRAGLGALFEAFERLKARLEKEGLFAPARKRPLPQHPRQIGIVTSPDAAALRDVLTTLRRRMSGIPIVLYPAPVQGKGAAERIAQAIRAAGERGECDVLIVCRGGGSIEDLWQFNEEVVARAIAESPIPVISGIGHETDFTIADFVADSRAPTPTAAAELVTPDRQTLLRTARALHLRLRRQMQHLLDKHMQHTDFLARRLVHPGEKARRQRERLGHLQTRLQTALLRLTDRANARLQTLPQRLQTAQSRHLQHHREHLRHLEQNLRHLSPDSALKRGYSLVRQPDGSLVRDSATLRLKQTLTITFARGEAEVEVGKVIAGK
ncbi:MAG: exodeoxyribonuclease VII large subunit [Methylobacillus sp.]|nr:exodeoxyribonuclease VII large subunit [Methylobacillus sp.]